MPIGHYEGFFGFFSNTTTEKSPPLSKNMTAYLGIQQLPSVTLHYTSKRSFYLVTYTHYEYNNDLRI